MKSHFAIAVVVVEPFGGPVVKIAHMEKAFAVTGLVCFAQLVDFKIHPAAGMFFDHGPRTLLGYLRVSAQLNGDDSFQDYENLVRWMRAYTPKTAHFVSAGFSEDRIMQLPHLTDRWILSLNVYMHRGGMQYLKTNFIGRIVEFERLLGIPWQEMGAADGQMIRLPIPDLSEERRSEMKKLIKTMGEKCKVSIRNIRREANDQLKAMLKSKDISEDEEKKFEKVVQKFTDDQINRVDEKVTTKEKEIMTI